MLDWSKVAPLKQPTKKQASLYRQWVKYLRDSKLTENEIQRRAKYYAENNERIPNA
jgi:hypothetical protein